MAGFLTSKSFRLRSTSAKSLLPRDEVLSILSTSSREMVAASDFGAGYTACHGAAAGGSLGLLAASVVAIMGLCLVLSCRWCYDALFPSCKVFEDQETQGTQGRG